MASPESRRQISDGGNAAEAFNSANTAIHYGNGGGDAKAEAVPSTSKWLYPRRCSGGGSFSSRRRRHINCAAACRGAPVAARCLPVSLCYPDESFGQERGLRWRSSRRRTGRRWRPG